ncbi:N-alpha-acetyltransferase 30 [Thunnus albacares]|uniref:N-alpha-acetyltransferase 30 n=1 Tax=Thunnus maccoyii TaxID=8240 RepID=UPI001C4CBF7A|nr:N-alpha-acetyltransferase 30 [Thunnus maccoyii]XP_042246149.1 N-alpha-acetyltransferase 30 [Thunnus maccoyii]XP_044232834.1 N-alpha-acetyltransferase 30 [Thunnus albacares]XP_044232835.1 N-alpha-acetyltransferase 30 [Thunnus albacares]|eukprot:superscaffoldBa00001436_g10535
MATVPPGPSSALPASPAEVPPFPGAGSAEPAGEDGEPASHRDECVPAGTGKKSQPLTEVKGSVKKKQKNMLARASPAALHLKMQAREQQQLNGLASPSEDADGHQHTGNRPDNPRPSVDNCDSSGSNEEASAARNNSEHCQHEGHSPCSKNGSHSPLVNNSMNGMPGFTRTEAAHIHPEDGGKEEEFDHTEPPRPPSDVPPDAAGPGGEESPADLQQQPPAAELARLDLSSSPGRAEEESHGIRYVRYESELQMPWIMRLITKDLSEPYSIYTYRYFIHNWPQLCFLAMVEQECVGAIVCKLDMHKKMFRRGYIAMLAVDSKHRRKSIGTNLVKKAIYAMVEGDCDEVVLETEITNKSALKLYENLGFVRDKRLFRYYLNGVDALRLKLWLR